VAKGTGKSVLLREIIKTLRKKYAQDAVAITASTGEIVFYDLFERLLMYILFLDDRYRCL
jgi:Cdc6-like AAA superfamily ATPase